MMKVWSRWGRSLLLFVFCGFLLLGSVANAFAQSSIKRQVLGTLHTHNGVEIAESAGDWKAPKPGSPIVENTFIRTSEDGAALIDLGQNGVIGLYPGGRIFLGTIIGGALPLGLEGGELAFRLPAGSKIELRTANAIVRPSGVVDVGGSSGFLEGFLRIAGNGETSVRVQNGSVMIRGIEGTSFMPVKAGQEARIGGSESEPKITAVALMPMGNDPVQDLADKTAIGGDRSKQSPTERKRGVPSVFGGNRHLAALVGGLGIVGGTLGGLAGAGTFDGNDNEGSEFDDE